MKMEFSKHALIKIKKRGLTKLQVKEAILKGQNRLLQPHGTIKCIYKKGDKSIVVVYFQNKDYYKIITAYKLI